MSSEWLKRISNFVARMPGIPVLLAVCLVALNFVLQLAAMAWPAVGWLAHTNLLLHIGVALGFIGILLGDAL